MWCHRHSKRKSAPTCRCLRVCHSTTRRSNRRYPHSRRFRFRPAALRCCVHHNNKSCFHPKYPTTSSYTRAASPDLPPRPYCPVPSNRTSPEASLRLSYSRSPRRITDRFRSPSGFCSPAWRPDFPCPCLREVCCPDALSASHPPAVPFPPSDFSLLLFLPSDPLRPSSLILQTLPVPRCTISACFPSLRSLPVSPCADAAELRTAR